MPTAFYPVFREYSIAVQNWLRDLIDLPNLSRQDFAIQKITLRGTTVADGAEGTTDGRNQHEVHLDTEKHGLKPNNTIRLYDTTSVTARDQQINNDNWYSILAVKDNILVLNKEYRKLRLDQPDPGGRARAVVNVMYAEMDESVATIASPLRNGLVQTPGIGFYLSDNQPKEGMRPKENYYTRRFYDKGKNKVGSVAVPPLQEYQLTYTINIWSPYRSYMSMLQYQIMSEFAPEKYFWIPGFGVDDDGYGFEYTDGTDNCRYDREHHGQWAHALMEGVADNSDLEVGANAATVYRTDITFVITNAYLALPFEREQAYIGEVNLEQHIEDKLGKI
jgi:hypothetical protein